MHHMSRLLFISVGQHLQETSLLQPRKEGLGNMRSTHTPDFEEKVLERIAVAPLLVVLHVQECCAQ